MTNMLYILIKNKRINFFLYFSTYKLKIMKKVLTFLTLVFASLQLMAQITYVKQDASGVNDGSSWENAYTDLSTALGNTTAGEVWVASGVYIPGGDAPDENARFEIGSNIAIYGGFAGTESSLEERNIDSNPVLLSGDVLGDDTTDDFDNNKTDNVYHVVYIDSLLTDVIFDGFWVSGGHTDEFTDGVDRYFWAGAGLFSYSPVTLRNCQFTQNFAATGAGLHITGDGSFGATIEDCVFEKNRALNQAAVQLRLLRGVMVRRCDFNDNKINRGAFYPSFSADVTVEDCNFTNNINEVGFGGAMFNWQTINLVIRNCTFTGNAAQNAAALYNDHRQIPPFLANSVVIEDCTFDGNGAALADGTGYGGCIYFWKTSFTISRCDFMNSAANEDGGAIYNAGANKICLLEDCTFSGSAATFGGAISNSSDSTFTTLKGCTFSENIAATSGGAIINAFGADLELEDCSFVANNARWGGGIYFQTDSTSATMSRTTFSSNIAENNGGAFTYFAAMDVTVDSCSFIGNQANFGGAISAADGDVDGANMVIRNATFNLNIAGSQGGALNINDVDTQISNGLFTGNFADAGGTGGAISMNAVDSSTLNVSIINSTFANNFGALANGIATWTGELEVASTLTLQNNIFYNPGGDNYAVEAGNTSVVSNGGNFSTDASMETILTHDMDQNGIALDPLFVDADNDNYRLNTGSPCIDAGVALNAPEMDITGMERINNIDIGAFEYDPELGVFPSIFSSIDNILVMPNPAVSSISIVLENDSKGSMKISVFDVNGREVLHQNCIKDGFDFRGTIDISRLPVGQYKVLISNGKNRGVASFVKIE